MTKEECKRVADLLWRTIALVEKNQSNYWTAEQLRLIAQIVEPPSYIDRPTNIQHEAV